MEHKHLFNVATYIGLKLDMIATYITLKLDIMCSL